MDNLEKGKQASPIKLHVGTWFESQVMCVIKYYSSFGFFPTIKICENHFSFQAVQQQRMGCIRPTSPTLPSTDGDSARVLTILIDYCSTFDSKMNLFTGLTYGCGKSNQAHDRRPAPGPFGRPRARRPGSLYPAPPPTAELGTQGPTVAASAALPGWPSFWILTWSLCCSAVFLSAITFPSGG